MARAHPSVMLRTVARASALSGAASAALFLVVMLAQGLPTRALWTLAYAVVGTAMLCVGGFAWIVLTLPPGAPWRRNGMRVAGALGVVLGAGWLALRVLASA